MTTIELTHSQKNQIFKSRHKQRRLLRRKKKNLMSVNNKQGHK